MGDRRARPQRSRLSGIFTASEHYREGPVEVRGTWRNRRLVLGLRERGRLTPEQPYQLIWSADRQPPRGSR